MLTSGETPVGVGIDLVQVAEIEESLALHGERYTARVYTEAELASWGTGSAGLALCFAAKEAALKALAPHDEDVWWQCIDVRPGESDTVVLELSGDGAALAARRGVERLIGSASLAGGHATAVVLALGATGAREGPT